MREEALALARAVGEPRLVAEALARLGEVLAGIGDPVTAAPLLDEALALVEAAADATAGPDARSRARFAESLARLRAGKVRGRIVLDMAR